eukprot:Rhum_TRINITY_DN476_c0_g2::Rhum_TRINITY_DN476_c0_g2_i1::g.1437::m.1437
MSGSPRSPTKRKYSEVSLHLGREWGLVERALSRGLEVPQELEVDGAWVSARWSAAFAEAAAERSHAKLHRLRVLVAVDTTRRLLADDAQVQEMRVAARGSVRHDDPRLPSPEAKAKAAPTLRPAEVWRGDCLHAGLALQDEGFNPVVLNMANQYNPGGGWTGGDGAQEENLFRRTAYFASLVPDPSELHEAFAPVGRPAKPYDYPLGDYSTVYSPDVLVVRGAESDGYPVLDTPRRMAFVACAAYRDPPCGPAPDFALPAKVEAGMLRKIEAVLTTAVLHGHDAVVLSAFGCGAFRNPPLAVARLFKRALEKPAYAGRLRRVVFAIFNDHNSGGPRNPDGNVVPFEAVFGEAVDVPAPKL